jgi:ABC-2 type transport system ATP-binding protein
MVHEITKRYEHDLLALDAVSLRVNPGEVYCLLGANGAGKTTMIDILMGFVPATSGWASINGINVMENPLETKKFVSYVSESVLLYGNFTARQNLEFFTRLGGKQNPSRDDCYTVLREVGLPEADFERRVRRFSKGMRQKVSMAIVVMRDTPAVLLDEPTFGLDPKTTEDILEIIDSLRNRGKAILMASQDIFRIKEIADRIGIMKEGRKVMERMHEELEYEDLQALYLNYMRGDYRADEQFRGSSKKQG